MKKLFLVIPIFVAIFLFFSCLKRFLCPDCEVNKPPIASAGPDQITVLPKDSVMLDGCASAILMALSVAS